MMAIPGYILMWLKPICNLSFNPLTEASNNS